MPANGSNLLHAGVHSHISQSFEAASCDFADQRKPELAAFVVGQQALVRVMSTDDDGHQLDSYQ